MPTKQMAGSFFGFNTNLDAGLDDAFDSSLEDDEYDDEGKYDALNDETFGSEAVVEDWEQDHEKLAQITESSRTPKKNEHINLDNYNALLDKNDLDQEIDVENTLSHLVIDDKDLTVPKPGVWDGPTILPTPKPKPLSETLKNVCTVEELERGLIKNRAPPGLAKVQEGKNFFFNNSTSNDKVQQQPQGQPQINGTGPLFQNQFSFLFNQNSRFPHPPFPPNMQNVRPMPNQPNLMRFPMPPPHPHMLLQPGGQRGMHPNNFPQNNFPHPPMGPLPFMRPDHLHPQFLLRSVMQNQQRQQNQPFFKNNQMPHMQYMMQNGKMFNQQNNFYHNNHGNDRRNGDYDEYAGLMNTREKNWLNSIQLLQLNTNQPYIDDFYFTVFCDRQTKKNENESRNRKQANEKGFYSNNNNNRDSRDRDHQPTFNKVNTPMQFENSLGKLQYSSVTAPRKIIDMDVVPNSDPQQSQSAQQKDTKRTRQLLLEIERLYMLLLKLEDRSNPLAIIAEGQRDQQQREQQQQQREAGEEVEEIPPKDPIKLKEELTLSILSSFNQFIKDEKFASLLSIRKGKTLFVRFVACLNTVEYRQELLHLWVAVIKGLTVIGRRDSHFLINFYTEFRRWMMDTYLQHMPFLELVKGFMNSSTPELQKSNLTFALTNKFGISVLSLMIQHAIEIFDNEDAAQHKWSTFIKAIGECIVSTQPTIAPLEPTSPFLLEPHFKQYRIDESTQKAFVSYFTTSNPCLQEEDDKK